jgi:N utilization substance protein B
MGSKPSKSILPKSILRRGARLAAVQALYDIEISNHLPEQVITSFQLGGGLAVLDGDSVPADPDFFIELVQGVSVARDDFDRIINEVSANRKVRNLESLMRTILRAGTYELARRDDIDAPVVISEYLTVTAAFYDLAETGYVNGILDRLSRVLRDHDISDASFTSDNG